MDTLQIIKDAIPLLKILDIGTGDTKALINGILAKKAQKAASLEEVKTKRNDIRDTLASVRASQRLTEENIQRVLQQNRGKKLSKTEKQTVYMKLRMYLMQMGAYGKMADNLEMINTRIEIAGMTEEFAQAIGTATDVVKYYNKNTPDLTRMMKNFNNAIKPINLSLSGDLDKMDQELEAMNKMIMQDDTFSDEYLAQLLDGDITVDDTQERVESEVSSYTQKAANKSEENKAEKKEVHADELLKKLFDLRDGLRG